MATPGLAEGTASASVVLRGSGLEAAWETSSELISHPFVACMGTKAVCKAHMGSGILQELFIFWACLQGGVPSCARSGSPYASHQSVTAQQR